MANPLSSMLDELMGRNRNALPSENRKDLKWDDEEVCSYFIAGYCPHDLFTNTKADLGSCGKIHDEKLRDAYRKSSRFEKSGLEEEFLSYLQKVDQDMRRKINKNKQRLELTQPGGHLDNVNRERVEDKVNQLSEKINALLAQAEQLGAGGKVDDAQRVIAMMEEMKDERDRCRKTIDTPTADLKVMEVCDTCGCFLILGDSQHRLDEHLLGKQHTGFAKIKATIEELIRQNEEKRKQRDEELRKARSKRDSEETAKKDTSGKSDRRKKSRSRSKERSSSDKSKTGHHRSSRDEKHSSSHDDRKHRHREKDSERKGGKEEKDNERRHRNGGHGLATSISTEAESKVNCSSSMADGTTETEEGELAIASGCDARDS